MKSQGNLNMRIAHAHEIATQLVGMQLAVANLLAISVSATSIVAGCVTYAVVNQPGAWPFWIVAGVIGCGLAVLIEGMTLGALIRIRLANTQIRAIVLKLETQREAAITAGLKVKRFTSWRRKRDATRAHRKSRSYSLPLAFIGASASATAGGLFYYQVLGSLGTYPSLVVSALFALIVTGTFVSSELFKDVQEEAVREGFRGGSLSEEALREETYRQTHQAVATEVTSYLASQNARDVIKKAASHLLDTVLVELRQRSAERVGLVTRVTDTTRAPENDMTPQQPAALLPPTGGVATTGPLGQVPDEKGGMSGLGTTTEQGESLMEGDTRATGRQPHAGSQPNDRDAGEVTDQPSGGARHQHLGIIEQMMLDALQKATAQEQATLQHLAATQPLATFTHMLQERYPTAASYMTEERVARVMAVFQAHNPQNENDQRDQATASVVRLAVPQRHQEDSDKATRERASAPERRVTARHERFDSHDRPDNSDQATGRTERQETSELRFSDKTTVPLPPLEATGDLTAEHILAYLAAHPGVKQVTVARVFGVSVRTIQRKLAAQPKPEP